MQDIVGKGTNEIVSGQHSSVHARDGCPAKTRMELCPKTLWHSTELRPRGTRKDIDLTLLLGRRVARLVSRSLVNGTPRGTPTLGQQRCGRNRAIHVETKDEPPARGSSERDNPGDGAVSLVQRTQWWYSSCLLYTSDAADE